MFIHSLISGKMEKSINLSDDLKKNTYFKWYMKLPKKYSDVIEIFNGKLFMFENIEKPFFPQSYHELLKECKRVRIINGE